MIGRALASEAAKTLSVRVNAVLVLILVGYIAVAAGGFAVALLVAPEESGVDQAFTDLAPLVYSMVTAVGYVFPLILGALMVTSEHRYRTLTPTFLAVPRRRVVLAAKLVVAAVLGAISGLAGLVASMGAGGGLLAALGGDPMLGEPDTWWLAARVVLAMALWGVVGVGVGVLIPNQIGSIVTAIAFTQFVEPLVRTAGAFVEPLGDVVRFLPGAAGDALVGASVYAAIGGSGESLDWWQGGLVLAGYAVVLTAVGAVTSWRRDVT